MITVSAFVLGSNTQVMQQSTRIHGIAQELGVTVKNCYIDHSHTDRIITLEVLMFSVKAKDAATANAFLATILNWIGVYEVCPECRKRHKWETRWQRVVKKYPSLKMVFQLLQ